MHSLPPSPSTAEMESAGHDAAALGDLSAPHAPEREQTRLLGGDPDPATLDAQWVLRRLMREATDVGTRTRQTSRVGALKLLGEYLGLWTGEAGQTKPGDPIEALTPEERRARIAELVKRAEKAGFRVVEGGR